MLTYLPDHMYLFAYIPRVFVHRFDSSCDEEEVKEEYYRHDAGRCRFVAEQMLLASLGGLSHETARLRRNAYLVGCISAGSS